MPVAFVMEQELSVQSTPKLPSAEHRTSPLACPRVPATRAWGAFSASPIIEDCQYNINDVLRQSLYEFAALLSTLAPPLLKARNWNS